MSRTATAPKAPAAPAVASSTDFGSPEAEALTRTQVKAFLAHTNNQGVVNELETMLKAGRNQIGWKMTGRILLEEIANSSFKD